MKIRNRTKTFKYKIIEFDYISLTSEKIEVCKVLHKTNSKLIFYLIILCFKLQGIKYEILSK